MDNDAITKELMALEQRYWQAIKDKDAKTCADLSYEPCIVTGAQGVGSLNKAQLQEMMEKQTQYTLESFELKDAHARRLGKDTAIVAYTVHEKLIVEGKPVELVAADSSTWVKSNGEWTCALHTEAVLGDPFGRDKAAKKT